MPLKHCSFRAAHTRLPSVPLPPRCSLVLPPRTCCSYSIEYAKTGRSSCKDTKCKKNIAAQALRVGKVGKRRQLVVVQR